MPVSLSNIQLDSQVEVVFYSPEIHIEYTPIKMMRSPLKHNFGGKDTFNTAWGHLWFIVLRTGNRSPGNILAINNTTQYINTL